MTKPPVMNFPTTLRPPNWPKSKMAATVIGGLANFFPMALRTKILVAIIWFSSMRNRIKAFPDTPDPWFRP